MSEEAKLLFAQLQGSISSTCLPDFFLQNFCTHKSSSLLENGVWQTAHKFERIYWANSAGSAV
jgi:hypothetical protein